MKALLSLPSAEPGSRCRQVLWYVLLGWAFTVPISIVLAEPLAFVAFPFWVCLCVRDPQTACRHSPYRWPVLLFAVLAVSTLFWSVRPEDSIEKMHRLLLFPLVFALPATLVSDRERAVSRAWLYVGALLAGSSILGAYDLVRVPVQVARGTALFDTGNMRDPQIYMAALCFIAAALTCFKEHRVRLWLYAALLLNVAGIVLHFKRGVWFACVIALAILGARAGKKRWLLFLLLAGASLLAVPQVRERLALLREVTSPEVGGRYVLWTRVAPELFRRYPQGMGWCAVEHEDFSEFDVYVQPKLDHLHNNALHIMLELGWAGLAIWLVWMVVVLRLTWRCSRVGRGRGPPEVALALGTLGAFAGLMLNGLVEYNFGDTEVLMLLCLVMGLSAVLVTPEKEAAE